jgi:hypothetical protein
VKRWVITLLIATFLTGTVGISMAQRWRRRRPPPARDRDGTIIDRRGVDTWAMKDGFKDDTFTFVRIAYYSWGGGWGNQRWDIDGPDSELNFSFRLQQLTSLKVNPEPIVLTLTDPRLFDYPFIYIVEPGFLEFSDDEVKALRHYLLNGGFLMVDDFWGDGEWYNFQEQMGRVFPDRRWEEVPLSHEIFHCVYDLKERPQVPAIGWGMSGLSYERPERADTREVHYRAWHDDNGRMVVFAGHNTDLGDGWEREGENEQYFREYSEKWAYPMGINIVTYAMTH